MTRMRIEWEALEPALRKLQKKELLDVLAEAYRALPASAVVTVFGQYIDLPLREASRSARRGAAPRRLLEAVQRFYADSRAGQYHESFNVNSRNFMDKSEGTELWISSCNQLFDKCVEASGKGHDTETCTAMDLLFELLEQIDTGSDDIIFFADEAGSWQVGVDYEKVLPAYFASLGPTAEPDRYATRVLELIDEHASNDRDRLLKAARRVANTTQRKALKARIQEQEKGRASRRRSANIFAARSG